MARVFKLVRNGLSDLNFLAAAEAGFRAQKWAPAQAPISYREIPAYVTEEIDFLVDRDSDDNLAATLRDLDEYAAMAEMFWHNRIVYTPVWLHVKMDGETYTRRALVKSLRYEWLSDLIAETGHAAVHDGMLRLFIERHPYWESLSNFQAPNSTLSGSSVRYDPSNTTDGEIVGTVPARARVAFRSATGPHLIDRLWMGIRSERYGDPDDFLLIWECEDGALGTDAALAAEAAASPGGAGNTKVVVDFATQPGWAKRLRYYILSMAGAGKTDEQRGRFMELLRAKVDASTECEMRLRVGPQYGPDASYISSRDVAITNTNWDYYEMGEIVLSTIDNEGDSWAFLDCTKHLDYMAIEIWAQRTSGYGSLHLDCMCPIPIDEGFCFLSDVGINYLTAPANYYLTERDNGVAWSVNPSGLMESSVIVNDHNFRFPPGETRIIVVYARDTQSVLTDDLWIDADNIPRWASLRGSSGYTT